MLRNANAKSCWESGDIPASKRGVAASVNRHGQFRGSIRYYSGSNQAAIEEFVHTLDQFVACKAGAFKFALFLQHELSCIIPHCLMVIAA
jgi:hypothetical protein